MHLGNDGVLIVDIGIAQTIAQDLAPVLTTIR